MNFDKSKFKEQLQAETEERYKLQAENIAILQEYKEQIQKLYTLSPKNASILQFEALNNNLAEKQEKLYSALNSERNKLYLKEVNKLLIDTQHFTRQLLTPFYLSPLEKYICELFKEGTLKEALNFYHSFFKKSLEIGLTEEQQITILKKAIEEKLKAEFEADFLEKCSCYQNNITNNLLKIIGASINSKTNKIEKKGNRLYVSTEIKKGEIFKLSIDKDKEITPAMFKYYIYFLTIATQHIKPIYNNGNMQAMQFIIINLDEVSEELGIRKDNLKNIFKDMLEAFQTVNIEKATYFANGLKVVSKAKRYITINNAKIINGFKIYKNKIEVCLNEAFTVSLINSQEMIIPLLLFRINQNQYPLSFIIGYFLLLHERRTQKGRNYNDFIYLDIETILNNSCKDIDNITKQKHSPREKGLFINNIQHLVNIGLLKEYKYKQNGVLYESNYIEDNTTFTQWRKYTLAYKFTDKIINECLKPYNKPIPKKSKTTK